MAEVINIRPHHLLCISGYKGANYNSSSAKNWDNIINALQTNPKQKVMITLQEDTLCKECRHSKNNDSTCDVGFVQFLDKQVKEFIKLKDGATYKYEKLMKKLFKKMTCEKHSEICNGCGWMNKGFCSDTFEKGKS